MLTSEKREVSGKELSAELGIEDISYALTSDGEPLLEILKKHCVVRVSGREREQIFFHIKIFYWVHSGIFPHVF